MTTFTFVGREVSIERGEVVKHIIAYPFEQVTFGRGNREENLSPSRVGVLLP